MNKPGLPFTHGHSVNGRMSPTYNAWRGMMKRCYDINHDSYPFYGGRGIGVCIRWRKSFENFLADMGRKPANMTLERIDNDADYSRSNCIWASHKAQARNRRNTKITAAEAAEIRASTEVQTVLAARYGISQPQVGRIKRGTRWKPE